MNFFLVLNGKKLKQVLILATAFLFTIGIVFADNENISVFSSQNSPTAIYKVDTKEKKIALTFDISWGEEKAAPIIDILQQKGIGDKVTFFLSAPWSKNHPQVVKKLVDMGAEIGSHGYKHVDYSRLSDEEIKLQIKKAEVILKEATGKKPTLLRTPNGNFDKRVLTIAESLGYTVIQWDTDSKDWLSPGVEQIVNNVIRSAHPGDIVLLHASDSAKQTEQALPIIIDKLRQQGYTFVTVSELIAGANVNVKELD
ncbi:polysaccharide deacetylase family sporulation protein PdaB [Microaerobacter geothermalis]|uniref:polysaccharide deacetylase family sporulation protein PdaB n=1 Tax=Microaerobacter geothermalis TaxID=674972 RepID=UPI001F471980|nr:polysaccharide deacetylase family sporulation protein PdaB [Microaerobacter geothermalis]MCF6095285.1 polysaccharide deacetylase family sporulation protein PdaB [Microaerobacter geothermalis]